MLLIKKIEQYDINNIVLCEAIKNNVMDDSNFIRILYANNNVVMNGIYLYLPISDIITEKYYNKYKCMFNINNYKDIIESIKNIEEMLLTKIVIKNKIAQYKIYDQLRNGYIKIFSDNIGKITHNNLFLLKISGIWETDTHYGVTYKFSKLRGASPLA